MQDIISYISLDNLLLSSLFGYLLWVCWPRYFDRYWSEITHNSFMDQLKPQGLQATCSVCVFLFHTDIKWTYTSLLVYHRECVCACPKHARVSHFWSLYSPLFLCSVFSSCSTSTHTALREVFTLSLFNLSLICSPRIYFQSDLLNWSLVLFSRSHVL